MVTSLRRAASLAPQCGSMVRLCCPLRWLKLTVLARRQHLTPITRAFHSLQPRATALLLCRAPQRNDNAVTASPQRHYSPRAAVAPFPASRHHNIGIIAHIDAGKTTTSERFLYYSHAIHSLGDVDRGDTHTDYLEQERERGITIKSACVTLHWHTRSITIIDTPGHVDFTQEVECALCALDGAVLVIDAVKGVQSQTVTVYQQAHRYSVPMIAFVNKMDRPGADYDAAMQSMAHRLNVRPLSIQMPLIDNNGSDETFAGVIDLVNMRKLIWPSDSESDGREFEVTDVRDTDSDYDAIVGKRDAMLELLAEHDEHFLSLYLAGATLAASEIAAAIRRATLAQLLVPTLCGAALRNTAVQPVLDAVTHYLPTPTERAVSVSGGANVTPAANGPMIALAFKVTHDLDRAALPIVYVRVYSGQLKIKSTITNNSAAKRGADTSGIKERVLKLLRIDGPHSSEVEALSVGEIGAIVGLKHVNSGDTLTTAPTTTVTLAGLTRHHDPVFRAAITADTDSDEKELARALQCLQREDPSVSVTVDAATGQTIIGSQGELHMEIIAHRLFHDFRAKAAMGKIRVAYRESVTAPLEHAVYWSNTDGSDAALRVRLTPLQPQSGTVVDVDGSEPLLMSELAAMDPAAASVNLNSRSLPLTPALAQSLDHALSSSLGRGPLQGFPIIDVKLELIGHFISPTTTPASLRSCAAKLVRTMLNDAKTSRGVCLMEPVMALTVSVEKAHVGEVVTDLTSRRRGHVDGIEASDDHREEIRALVPLSQLMGYANALRSRTQGTGSFTMQFQGYRETANADD